MSIGIGKDKSDSGEEIGLPRTVTSNNNIMVWTQQVNHGGILVGFKPLNYDLGNEHDEKSKIARFTDSI
jgi:hypothetical protein